MEDSNVPEKNCTSGKGGAFGCQTSSSSNDADQDRSPAPSGMAGLISCAAFLLLFVIILCCLARKRPTEEAKNREKQEREKYIEERLTRKTVEKKEKVVSSASIDIENTTSCLQEMEKGRTKTNDAKLGHHLQTQGSRVYVSFCEEDEIMMDQTSNGGDDGSEIMNKRQPSSHASIPPCAICTEYYLEKDIICWPKSEQCNHTFHLECIKPWLMHHRQCPICRQNYLESNDDAEDDAEKSKRTTTDGTEEQATAAAPGSEPIPERISALESPALAGTLRAMHQVPAENSAGGGDFFITSRNRRNHRAHTTEERSSRGDEICSC